MKRSQIAAAFIVMILVAGILVGLYVYMSVRVDTSTVDYIKQMQRGPNNFLDLANDINVSSADDIGYQPKGRYSINIYYGDQIIEMNKNCFKDSSYKKKLKEIGIEVLTHENEDGSVLYRVTYWGEPVDEYSLVN